MSKFKVGDLVRHRDLIIKTGEVFVNTPDEKWDS
jgi:hypothetical protein